MMETIKWKDILLPVLCCIGCVLFACQREGTRTKGDMEERELAVMSFNILHDVPSNPVGYTWPERKDRLIALLKEYNPDILCAQEDLFGQGLEIVQAMGWEKIGVSKNAGTVDGSGEFCGIYYNQDRLTLKTSGYFWLSQTPNEPSKGWDASTNRICTWARFSDRHMAADFYVFNLHADHIGMQARIESSRLVLDKIRSIARGMPVILAGDFNTTRDNEAIKVVQERLAFARDIAESEPLGPLATYNGADGREPTRLLDYIFVSDRFRVLRYATLTDANEEGLYPSDHFPILVILK